MAHPVMWFEVLGNGWKRTPSIQLKTVVAAPTPRPIDVTAATVT